MGDELLMRSRPTVVEAKRVTVENRDAIIAWINQDGHAWPYGTKGVTWHDAEQGIHDAFVGEWIVKTPWGEYQKVSDAVLFARFESVVAAVSE